MIFATIRIAKSMPTPHVIAFCQQVPRDHVGLNLHVTSEDIKKPRIAKYR